MLTLSECLRGTTRQAASPAGGPLLGSTTAATAWLRDLTARLLAMLEGRMTGCVLPSYAPACCDAGNERARRQTEQAAPLCRWAASLLIRGQYPELDAERCMLYNVCRRSIKRYLRAVLPCSTSLGASTKHPSSLSAGAPTPCPPFAHAHTAESEDALAPKQGSGLRCAGFIKPATQEGPRREGWRVSKRASEQHESASARRESATRVSQSAATVCESASWQRDSASQRREPARQRAVSGEGGQRRTVGGLRLDGVAVGRDEDARHEA